MGNVTAQVSSKPTKFGRRSCERSFPVRILIFNLEGVIQMLGRERDYLPN